MNDIEKARQKRALQKHIEELENMPVGRLEGAALAKLVNDFLLHEAASPTLNLTTEEIRWLRDLGPITYGGEVGPNFESLSVIVKVRREHGPF